MEKNQGCPLASLQMGRAACALVRIRASQPGLGWEGADSPPEPQPPARGRDTSHQPRLPPAPSSLALSTPRDGAPTAALGSLCQRRPHRAEFLPSICPKSALGQLRAIPPRPVTAPPVQSPSPAFLSAPSGTGRCHKVSPEPSLPQAEQPQVVLTTGVTTGVRS